MSELNIKMTKAWRILGKLNYIDAVFNHISCAWVDDRGRIFITMNPDGLFAIEVDAQDWITFPLDEVGRLNPKRLGVNADGFALHAKLHAARKKPGCALHTHSENALAVGATGDGLLAISQTSIEFATEITYVDYDGLFRGGELVPSLSQLGALGGVAFLRNHGLLVVAEAIEEAVYMQHYVEVACRIQMLALSQGKVLVQPSKEIVARAAADLKSDRADASLKLFMGLERTLLPNELVLR